MSQQQCPFCQLIDNPQQLMVVGETDNFYAWLDINPRAKGHSMVVPKEHIESLLELDPDQYQEAMRLTREVIEKATEGLGADGVSVTVNVGEASGQMVPHAYIQIFPRFEDEENAGTPTGAIFPQREELQPKLEEIQEKMGSVSADFSGGKDREPHPQSQKFKEEMRGGRETEDTEEQEEDETEEETGSRIVDRQEAAEKSDSEEMEEEEAEEKEDEEVSGEGNWDGESFEWR